MRPQLALSLFVSCIVMGCATPSTMNRTSAKGLARTQLGMTEDEVRKVSGNHGEPVFMIMDDHEYVCRKFVSKLNGVPYYFLWEDARLASVASGENCWLVEKTHGVMPGTSELPHEHGYAELLAPFNPPRAPEAFDYAAESPNFRTRAERRKQARAEFLMWSPLIILFLPFAPLNVPAEMYDDAATVAAYSRAYRVMAGMDELEIEKLIGEPDHVLGNAAAYGVYTYHYRPADGESMFISVGMRGGRSVWVRYRYNAYAEYTGVDEPSE